MKRICLLVVFSLAVLAPGPTPGAEPDLQHIFAPYRQLLDAHLAEHELDGGGLVSAFDYRAALASSETPVLLEQQNARLKGFDPEQLHTRSGAVAFWVNAYNYFMLEHILGNPVDDRPVASVRDFGNFFSPYKVFGRKLFSIGGRKYALREIELEILLGETFARRGWKDARVHFMVNCASVGCPPLRSRIYTAENLEAMLAENTRRTLDTPLHLERDASRLRVSSLFDWYADDFIEQSGSVRGFIEAHGSERARASVQATEDLEFIDYDWSLNNPDNTGAFLDELR